MMLLKPVTSVTSFIINHLTGNKPATNWQQPVTSFTINNFHAVKWWGDWEADLPPASTPKYFCPQPKIREKSGMKHTTFHVGLFDLSVVQPHHADAHSAFPQKSNNNNISVPFFSSGPVKSSRQTPRSLSISL
jgi:hypothetical protein